MLAESPVTAFFLILNVLIGLYTLTSNPDLIDRWAFKPFRAVREREWSRWLTAGFVHVGFGHLLFNMVTLFFFGPTIEGVLGPVRFLIVYVGAELAANALTYWRYKDNPAYSAVGASGAISGVLFSFCLFFPFEKIYLMFIPIGIWAVVFAPLYIALSVYAAAQGGGRVAHEAHLGGALGGLLLTVLLYPASVGIFLAQFGL
jgi:membrane associated rhomboid family serine protease